MRKLDKIILHSTATPEGRHVDAAEITRWHLERGFDTIGYHFVIQLDGTIELGRFINKVGAHTKGKNRGSVGIAYVGGCDADMEPKDTLNDKQHESLLLLVDEIRNRYGDLSLHGHNEFSNKACPSFDVIEKFGWDYCLRSPEEGDTEES